MTTTDTSERGLERQIRTAPTADPCDPSAVPHDIVQERPAVHGAGWVGGESGDYDRVYCVDLRHLGIFLRATARTSV